MELLISLIVKGLFEAKILKLNPGFHIIAATDGVAAMVPIAYKVNSVITAIMSISCS